VICYLRAALADDQIEAATWLVPGNGRLRVARRFQIRRASDHETLVRAEIEYACIELKSGRPARWPAEFRERYVVREDVASLIPELAQL
jgi:acyl-CoA thioester hydrolase